MTLSALSPAAIALNRFGLGARPGDAVPGNPRRFVSDQLDRYEPRTAGLASLADAGALVQRYRRDRRAERQQAGVAAGAKPDAGVKAMRARR